MNTLNKISKVTTEHKKFGKEMTIVLEKKKKEEAKNRKHGHIMK